MRQIPKNIKPLIIGLIAALGIVGLWLGYSAYSIHRSHISELKKNLPEWSIGDSCERALIIAPHSDDETLGCGGLIRDIVGRGAKVRVVVMTNGDGFYYAAARDFHDLVLQPGSYVEFGYDRQQESIAALKTLGLPEDAVTFLGYPDRGLAHMWLYNWEPNNLYESPYTRSTHSPYNNSYRPNTPHCGKAALQDLESIMRSFRPTSVYYPHTSEQHPDHWATNCFVTQALYETGLLDKVRSGMYLVHRGDWPVPQGLHRNLRLTPPSFMKGIGTRWYELLLSSDTEDRKVHAIHEYHTQLPVLGRFLMSFARTNELFGRYPPYTIRRVDHFRIGACESQWSNIRPCVLDPVSDGLNVDMARNGDLKEIRCCYDDKNVYVLLGLADRYSPRMTYTIRLHGLPDGKGRTVDLRIRGKKCRVPGVKLHVYRDAIEVSVSTMSLGRWDALMVNADSSMSVYEVDHTAWRLLLPEKN